MNIIQSINSVYVLFFVIKMHFYIMKNPFYPLNIKKLNFILIYLLFSILVCMWPFFLAEDFFLSFHGMHLMGGWRVGQSKQQLWKDGGSVFEAIFRMFMTFLKVIKKKIDKHSCKMFFLYFLKPKLSFTALERIIFMMYFCKNNLQFGHTKFDHPIYESMHVCISYIFL